MRVTVWRVRDGAFLRVAATGLSYPGAAHTCAAPTGSAGLVVADNGNNRLALLQDGVTSSALVNEVGSPNGVALAPGFGVVVSEYGGNRVLVATSVTITQHPGNGTVAVGATISFTVAISGASSGLTYQWTKGGVVDRGVDGPVYAYTGLSSDRGASFTIVCTVSHALGLAVSDPGLLTVLVGAPPWCPLLVATPLCSVPWGRPPPARCSPGSTPPHRRAPRPPLPPLLRWSVLRVTIVWTGSGSRAPPPPFRGARVARPPWTAVRALVARGVPSGPPHPHPAATTACTARLGPQARSRWGLGTTRAGKWAVGTGACLVTWGRGVPETASRTTVPRGTLETRRSLPPLPAVGGAWMASHVLPTARLPLVSPAPRGRSAASACPPHALQGPSTPRSAP